MPKMRSALVLVLAPLLLAAACHRKQATKAAPAPKAATAKAAPAAPAKAAAHAAKPAPAAHPALGAAAATKAELPTIAPAALAKAVKAGHAPRLLQVGFRKLYLQAHIPGSTYAGPGYDAAGIARLTKRVAKLAHDTPIVIYCGCCPWSHCPNVLPAYQALHKLGFTHVQVLRIAHDFGADWAAKGYPVASGA